MVEDEYWVRVKVNGNNVFDNHHCGRKDHPSCKFMVSDFKGNKRNRNNINKDDKASRPESQRFSKVPKGDREIK